jgi:hypothetical protein
MAVLGRLGAELGEERVFAIARDVIIEVAREQGRELARQMGGDGLDRFAAALENWKKGDAYQMDTLESTPERLSFNVTRCRYAEMYRSLGIAEVGALLSCNRDFSLVEGSTWTSRSRAPRPSCRAHPTATSASWRGPGRHYPADNCRIARGHLHARAVPLGDEQRMRLPELPARDEDEQMMLEVVVHPPARP